jgi:hypothetical protein
MFRKLVFDPSGAYVANADISEKLALDVNKSSGGFTIKFSFLNGVSICSEGMFTAQRIHAD